MAYARTKSRSMPITRGLHSSTFQLNIRAFCGIGVAVKRCVGGVQAGVKAGVKGLLEGIGARVFFCQKRLRLS